MFEIKGKIEFDPINVTKKHNRQASWKRNVIVKFDCDLHLYYSWFLEKRFNLKLNKPLRGTHITIISDIVDNQIYEQAREIFDGKELTFQYDPTYIRSNATHWWIKVYCDDVKNIRTAMGLTPDPYFGLHLTIGLATHLQEEHSKYIIRQCIKFNI
jgi:hypothetical protein